MKARTTLRAALGVLGLLSAFTHTTAAFASSRGSTVLIEEDAAHALVADPDRRALVRVDLATDDVRVTSLGGVPAELAIVDETHVAVALRSENVVVLLERASLSEVARAAVPSDPWGLAVTPSGDVLVTSTWGRALTALDGRTLAVKWQVPLAREPRGVVVSADGARAWVSHLIGDALSVVALGATEAPTVGRWAVLSGGHRNRIDSATGAGTLHPTAALAFGLALSDDGHRLFVPHRLAQNGEKIIHASPGSYGGVPIEEDTTVAAIAVVRTGDGRPLGAQMLAKDPTKRALSLSASPFEGVSIAPAPVQARQLTSAVVAGDRLLVTSFGTGELLDLDANAFDPAASSGRSFVVGRGVSGVDAHGALAVAYASFDHTLAVVDLSLGATKLVAIPGVELEPVLARGRALFFDETDKRISRDGRACAGCHPEGRDDGIVWHLGMGPRQTPTLLGRLERGPYGWNGKHPTLAGNVRETVGRLGGRGLSAADEVALVTYLQHGLSAPKRDVPVDASVARGRELFLSADVGCGGCHSLDREGSDRARYDVGSKTSRDELSALRTPPLSFVGETAPYFHDGRYGSLEELLRKNPDSMGRTMKLSDAEIGALAAFLRTL